MAENNFKGTVEALSKTVVGDAIHIGDTIILPLVDVSFAVGAGAFNADKKEKGAGGIGGKMTPSAVLVIQNGHTKLVNIKNQDTVTKLLDMVPDVMDRFTSRKEHIMYKKQVCVCEENRRICVVLGGSRNGFGSGLTGLILPDPVYYSVYCGGILPVLLLKIKCKQKNIK